MSSRDVPTDTAGGDGLLIDTDVHEYMLSGRDIVGYLPRHWQEYVAEVGWNRINFASEFPYTRPTPRTDWLLEDGTFGTSLDKMREHLFDGEGVTTAILNGLFHGSATKGNYEFATALVSAYNDWQIDKWLEPEPRLRGSVHIVAHDPKVAVYEIDRIAEHPSIVQVFLPTVTDRQYGDPYYHPIFEAAIRHRLAVALHHGGHTRTVFGYPRYYVEWHTLAAPMAAINQLVSLISNGVFDTFPELKVVLLETGVAWLPWLMWRLDQQYREYRSEVPWVKRLPSEHIRDSVRISTQPVTDVKPEHFASLVEMCQTDRVFVFATDYPHLDADSPGKVLTHGLPTQLRERIRWRNALETYGRLERMGALPAVSG
jgi:predicted TIM-barrel fold metal-dependent hydrolase